MFAKCSQGEPEWAANKKRNDQNAEASGDQKQKSRPASAMPSPIKQFHAPVDEKRPASARDARWGLPGLKNANFLDPANGKQTKFWPVSSHYRHGTLQCFSLPWLRHYIGYHHFRRLHAFVSHTVVNHRWRCPVAAAATHAPRSITVLT